MEAYLDLDQWCYMLGRIEDHLRSAHGRGVYLEMEGAFWNMYCGLPRVSCPECGFTVTVEGVCYGYGSQKGEQDLCC